VVRFVLAESDKNDVQVCYVLAELHKNDGRLSAAVLAIVRSPQFRMIRGRDVAIDE